MRTVLLADSDPDIRRILLEYLAANELRVEACPSSVELLERVAAEPPAAVILEPYGMGVDPVEIVRALRTGAVTPRPIPVLVYTSSPWRSVLGQIEALGASVLTKPARPARVLLVLEALLRGGAPDVPPPDPSDRSSSLGA